MTADPAVVIATARSWLGTPYHDQASLRGVGCDCLGWRAVSGLRWSGMNHFRSLLTAGIGEKPARAKFWPGVRAR